uniref:Uncharacterized protein n=1 Tax=Rhizophora mucronata TaxID=61149 RepID=A0A2P2J133_RHIMU
MRERDFQSTQSLNMNHKLSVDPILQSLLRNYSVYHLNATLPALLNLLKVTERSNQRLPIYLWIIPSANQKKKKRKETKTRELHGQEY